MQVEPAANGQAKRRRRSRRPARMVKRIDDLGQRCAAAGRADRAAPVEGRLIGRSAPRNISFFS
jgi:hypothetical protein